jgi:hypothetical protein
MREFSAFLFAYKLTYIGGVYGVITAIVQNDVNDVDEVTGVDGVDGSASKPDAVLRTIACIVAPFYTLLPLYKLWNACRNVSMKLNDLADSLDTTEDDYETALCVTRQNVVYEIQGFKEPGEINGYMSFALWDSHYDIMSRASMCMSIQTVMMGSYKRHWWAFKIFVLSEKAALAMWLIVLQRKEYGAWAGVIVLGIGCVMCVCVRPYIDGDESRVDLCVRITNFGIMGVGGLIAWGKVSGGDAWVLSFLFGSSITAFFVVAFAVGPLRVGLGFWKIGRFLFFLGTAFKSEDAESLKGMQAISGGSIGSMGSVGSGGSMVGMDGLRLESGFV